MAQKKTYCSICGKVDTDFGHYLNCLLKSVGG